MSSQLSAIAAVLTVELAPDAVAQGYQPPRPLERTQGEELAWALAADLQQVLGDLQDYGLVVPTALYDLTEILRPGLPMVDILMELYRGGLQGGPFQPQLMAIGAHQGHWPVAAIAPERTPGAGPMLGLPLVFVGPAEAMADLERRLEEHLLEKGRAGLRTRELMESDFQVPAVNLAYATFNDLCAMLRLQLEQHGFAELWSLLQGALFHPERRQVTRLDSGNAFWLDGGRVYTPFYTLAQWQAEGGGRYRRLRRLAARPTPVHGRPGGTRPAGGAVQRRPGIGLRLRQQGRDPAAGEHPASPGPAPGDGR